MIFQNMTTKLCATALVCLAAACGGTPEQRKHEVGCFSGMFTGALLGAAVGSAFGSGTGNDIAQAVGAGVGAQAGSNMTCG